MISNDRDAVVVRETGQCNATLCVQKRKGEIAANTYIGVDGKVKVLGGVRASWQLNGP